MRSENRIPAYTAPKARPLERHHTARYYAHRVKESLNTRISKLICTIFLALLFLVGLITFILWLSLRPHRPRFFVHEFSIPGLAQEDGFNNAQIIYNATARNSNQNIGIYYLAPLQLNVFYNDQNVGGLPVLSSFYQEPKNSAIIAGALNGPTLTLTREQWQQIRGRGQVDFRIEITSIIRFKISTWDSKQHKMHANCPIVVGPDGELLPSSRDRRCHVYFG